MDDVTGDTQETDDLVDAALAAFPGSVDVTDQYDKMQDALGDHRPNVYWDKTIGKYVYRASALGGCTKALTMTRRGMEGASTPQKIQDAYDEGIAMENVIIARFREEYGFTELSSTDLLQYGAIHPTTRQLECEISVGKKAVVRVHPDGVVQSYSTDEALRRLGVEVGDRFVLEVKKFSKATYAKWKNHGFDGFPYYDWQFSIERMATKLPGVYVIGVMQDKDDNPHKEGSKEAELWEPTIDFIDVKFYRDPPRKSLRDVVQRVMAIENTAENLEAGEGEEPDCEFKMYPCPFYDTAHDGGIWLKAGDDEEDEKYKGEIADWGSDNQDERSGRIRQAITNLMVARAVSKDAKAKEDVAKAVLAEELQGDKGDWWKCGSYVVSVDGKEGNKDYAKMFAAMEKDGIDVEKYVVRKPGSTWIGVKNMKDEVKAGVTVDDVVDKIEKAKNALLSNVNTTNVVEVDFTTKAGS